MKTRGMGVRTALAAGALLVLLAAGCSLFRPKTVLSIYNAYSLAITHVYVFPVGGNPGFDVLSGGSISPGATQQLLGESYAAGSYTVRVVFSSAAYTDYTVVFDGNPYTLTVTG